MNRLILVAGLLSLAGCATPSTSSTSLSFGGGQHFVSGPVSKDDPRLGQPRFYSDEDDGGWWTHAARLAN